MGRILTIRVSAVTHDEAEVFRTWPRLCALAWPGQGEAAGGAWKPHCPPAVLAAPVAAEPWRRGVMELSRALCDEARFGDWPEDLRQRMDAGIAGLEKRADALEAALADWQPKAAHAASTAMEDILDELERLGRD